MRNASKNTIKRVMRKAKYDQSIGMYFDIQHDDKFQSRYFLFNNVGAQIFRTSKGKICNRGLIGIEKYAKTKTTFDEWFQNALLYGDPTREKPVGFIQDNGD